ncbi:MAG: toxin-activating lysine-acyltransferase [Pseudomonadota bacterium]
MTCPHIDPAGEFFTLKEMLDLTGIGSARHEIAALIGLVLPLLDGRLDIEKRTFGWHFDRLARACTLQNTNAFFDGYGRQCGMAVWTHVRTWAEQRLVAHGPRVLGAGEFATRGRLWILEAQFPHGMSPALLRFLRDRSFAREHSVTYFRHARGRRLVKRLSAEDRTRFAREVGRGSRVSSGAFLKSSEGRELMRHCAVAIRRAIDRGRALMLLRTCERLAALPLAVVLQRLETPLGLGQICLKVSDTGEPMSLLTWAWLDRHQANRCQLAAPETIARHEWNAGDLLCVCDAVAAPEGRPALLHDLSGAWFPGEILHVFPGWAGLGARVPVGMLTLDVQRRHGLRDCRPDAPSVLAELLQGCTC